LAAVTGSPLSTVRGLDCLLGEKCASSVGHGRGVAAVLRSATSGAIVLVAAEPAIVGSGAPESEQPPGVVAAEISLTRFEKAIRPMRFQLAVVDRDGKILIHSDNETHQGQSI